MKVMLNMEMKTFSKSFTKMFFNKCFFIRKICGESDGGE